MKQKSLPFYLVILMLLIIPNLNAQVVPELVFRNPVLISGTALQNGAKYRFVNAGKDIDAMVEIKRRSASNVVVNNIDLTSFGWDKAFQPELGIPGTVAPNQSWWVEFEISFYKIGTNTRQQISQFDVTSLDVDGDNVSIQEFVQFAKPKSVTYSAITNLTSGIPDVEIECGNCGSKSVLEMCTWCSGTGTIGSRKCTDCNGSGKLYSACRHSWDGEINYNVTGPVMNFLNIDTLGTAVMATYHYEKKDRITIKMGGKSGARSSTAGMRLNSIWFRAFNLSAIGVLPTKLNDFNAKYDKQNVILTWSTEQERSFSHFIIEKSINGADFKEEAIIFGKDNGAVVKHYSFNDDLSLSKTGITSGNKGIVYYRLRLVDMNLASQKSVIRIIKIGEMNEVKVQAFPNPVVNELRITVPDAWQNTSVTYDLYAINGKVVKRVIKKNANQTEVLKMNALDAGVYMVKVSSANETVVKQVVKNNF